MPSSSSSLRHNVCGYPADACTWRQPSASPSTRGRNGEEAIFPGPADEEAQATADRKAVFRNDLGFVAQGLAASAFEFNEQPETTHKASERGVTSAFFRSPVAFWVYYFDTSVAKRYNHERRQVQWISDSLPPRPSCFGTHDESSYVFGAAFR